MVDKPGSPTDALFDAVIQRSFVPAPLRIAVQPFVVMPGPLGALTTIVPDLMELAASAACQTVGMLFDADVVSAPATGTPQTVASGRIDIELADRIGATISVHLPADVATLVAQKMGGPEAGAITDEGRMSAAGELCKLFVGRVEANLRERKLTVACSQPAASGAATLEMPSPEVGQAMRLAVPGAGDVFVLVAVSNPAGAQQSTPAPATADVGEPVAATTA
jgi:CheY-specific phosphatase CheX